MAMNLYYLLFKEKQVFLYIYFEMQEKVPVTGCQYGMEIQNVELPMKQHLSADIFIYIVN